jgi:hypothetical protein
MTASVATVIRAPALGPSLGPWTSKSTSRSVSGAPATTLAVVAADHPAASHWAAVPATWSSVKTTLSAVSGDRLIRTVNGLATPTVRPAAFFETNTGLTVADPVPVPGARVVLVGRAVVGGAEWDRPVHAAATIPALTSTVKARRRDR